MKIAKHLFGFGKKGEGKTSVSTESIDVKQ